MKSLYLLFGCLILQQISVAQLPPWNAKFIVYHPDGFTDTLWVGCDENATDGYDVGLDSLDNSFDYPISIGAFSPEVDAEFGLDNCVNLKREILPFADVRQYTFYVVYDDEVTSEPVQIKWDSLDYLYEHDGYMIYQATLIAQTGYIEAIDNTSITIFKRNSINPKDIYFVYSNYLEIFAELTAFECEPLDNVLKIRLDIIFLDYTLLINELSSHFIIYPNPAENFINIRIENPNLYSIKIFNQLGASIYSQTEYISLEKTINITDFPLGLYLIEFSDSNTNTYLCKFLKN